MFNIHEDDLDDYYPYKVSLLQTIHNKWEGYKNYDYDWYPDEKKKGWMYCRVERRIDDEYVIIKLQTGQFTIAHKRRILK